MLGKDLGRNRLVVAPRAALLVDSFVAGEVNVLVDPQLWPAEVLVQSRYREAAKPAQVEFCASSPARSLIVRYREPQLRPAPGQVAAVYDSGGALLAGAVVGHVQ